jgi:hypothetical protein
MMAARTTLIARDFKRNRFKEKVMTRWREMDLCYFRRKAGA